jgi:hypothetical protein
VFLIQAQSEIVGVSGLDRQTGMPSDICWLGWFAIRPNFALRLGRGAIIALCDFARNLTCNELWVYTGDSDNIAMQFYTSPGFELLGPASEWAQRPHNERHEHRTKASHLSNYQGRSHMLSSREPRMTFDWKERPRSLQHTQHHGLPECLK